MSTSSPVRDGRPDVRQARRAAASSWMGSAVEYYDFTTYGAASALVFGRLFFPSAEPAVGTLIALATFGAGYVARPLGGLFWGHIGDRVGRKTALVLTLGLMGAATFVIGCLPTYETLGVGAPVLLVLCRLAQGLSAGGEQAGANAMTLEHAPARRRAFYTSFTLSGTQAGTLLASLVFVPVAALPDESLYSWGWRVPFWCSLVVVGVAFVIRKRLDEPAVFERSVEGDKRARIPALDLVRHDLPAVLRVVGAALFAVMGTTTSVFALAYGTSHLDIDRSFLLTVGVVGNAVAIVVIPLWGMLSDRKGRRPVFLSGLVMCIGLAFAYFGALESRDHLLIMAVGIALIGVAYSASNAVWPALFGEMFQTRVRYSGTAIGTQLGFMAAGFAPTIMAALEQPGPGGWLWSVVFAAACLSIAAVAAAMSRETYLQPLSEAGTAR